MLRLFFNQKSDPLQDIDFGQTREISLAESSLVEMLNIYEEKQNQRSLDLVDFNPEDSTGLDQLKMTKTAKTRRKSPPKHTCSHKKTINKTHDGDLNKSAKKIPSRKTDWSHVKSSGYGSINTTINKKANQVIDQICLLENRPI